MFFPRRFRSIPQDTEMKLFETVIFIDNKLFSFIINMEKIKFFNDGQTIIKN